MARLLALLLFLGLSQAQLTYTLVQGHQPLGQARQSVQPTAQGYLAQGSSFLTGAFQWSDQLFLGPHFHPHRYILKGSLNGRSVSLKVHFGSSICETVNQAGHLTTLSFHPSGPLYLVDNNLLDGWQVLLLALGHRPQRVEVMIPQSASFGQLDWKPEALERLTLHGRTYQAWRIGATLHVDGQTIALQLWGEAKTHRLLQLEQGSIRFTLGATTLAHPNRKLLAAWASCLTSQPVQVPSTGALLAGTLTLPRGTGPFPALLILPGSGPVDQNGNAPGLGLRDDLYAQLADALSCHGFAVLRYSKLGIPPSTGNADRATLATYIQNVVDLVDFLRHYPGIDPHWIALIGHSEGALIALAAASQVHPAAVVLLEGPGLPLAQVLRQQVTAQARAEGLKPARIQQLLDELSEALKVIRASHGDQLALTGNMASNPYLKIFAPAAGLLRSELAQDPARLANQLAQEKIPMLIVQGLKDLQVLPPNAQALVQADPQATLLEFPRLTHDLVACHEQAVACLLPAPGTPLDPRLIEGLLAWLRSHLG
jgi:fermentation-respiration switch protein FrsA (DUF1100 family)